MKYIKFNQLFNYCTHITNEIKRPPKVSVKAKGTRGNQNMKDNFMERYCNKCTFLEGLAARIIPNQPLLLSSSF